ncbi:MAG: hypothetical protein FJ125_16795 [Deltaproteobacteria bacterium]|nr:hypothetical protein [Deltaproteobacteria bacterium]
MTSIVTMRGVRDIPIAHSEEDALQLGRYARALADFVDDLDRVLPERAVEILEALKNFVDVPGCVFVIACDYEVVRKGLKVKFHVGEDELQGRSFFDKIIQVPFRMPVHSYDVAAYVAQMLRRIGWSFEDADLADYRAFLEHSVGFNPRSIKRLCNTLLLLKAVASGDPDERTRILLEDRGRLKILFGLVCLEAQYEKAHAALRRLQDETLGLMLLEPDRALKETFGETIEGVPEDARPNLVGLLEALGRVVDSDGNRSIDVGERARLEEIVRLSAITSGASDERASRPQRRTVD